MYYKYYQNIKSGSSCPKLGPTQPKLNLSWKKSNPSTIRVLKINVQTYPNVELESDKIGSTHSKEYKRFNQLLNISLN